MMNCLRFLFALMTVCLGALRAQGALLEYEGFDYPGALGSSVNTLNGGTGWGANAWADLDLDVVLDTTNISLSFPAGVGFTPAGARIGLTATDTDAFTTRTPGTTMNLSTAGQTWYSSALFRTSAVTGQASNLNFINGPNTRWSYGINATGNFYVSVAPGTQQATSGTTLSPNTTYFLVSKIRTNTGPGGNDEVFLQIFDESEIVGNEPVTDAGWDLAANGGSSVVLNSIRLSMTNGAGQTNYFDEFRVGTTWADVVNPVPEPGTITLLASTILALVYGWHRKSSRQECLPAN